MPRHSFSDFGPKCQPPEGGVWKNFETFCMGVGKILGLGGSKYRPGGGGVGGQAGRDPKVPGWDTPPGVGKKKPAPWVDSSPL